MTASLRSICLIAGGLAPGNLHLQPWRYLAEVASQLSKRGHRITLLTDGGSNPPAHDLLCGMQVLHLPTVRNYPWKINPHLQRAVEMCDPDITLWNLGLTSFALQSTDLGIKAPTVGIFTSPIYRFHDLSRLGMRRLIQGYRLSAVHLLGSLIPRAFFYKAERHLCTLVIQTYTTRQQIIRRGLWPGDLRIIPPGVDKCWRSSDPAEALTTRASLGFGDLDRVVVYFGSPDPLRGLHTLVRALELARRADPSLRLLILSRGYEERYTRELASLENLFDQLSLRSFVKRVTGFLEPEELARCIAGSNAVALPFELLPSDAPLSILEAQALGKPIVTTRLACLPEMVAHGPHSLANPGDPLSLSKAILDIFRDHRLQCHVSCNGSNKAPALARSWEEAGEEWSHFIQDL